MPLYTNNLQASQLPFTVGPTIVRPIFDSAVALRTLGVFVTTEHSVRFPVISADPPAAVVAEGAEIPPQNMATDELVSVPVKLAVQLITSKEALDDSNGLSEVIAASLARSLGRTLDVAVFGAGTTGFRGLAGVTAATKIDGGAFDSLDPFIQAQYRANVFGTDVNAWVANPADAEEIALIAEGEGSNRKLINAVTDGENGLVQSIAGVPLFTTPAVESGKIYGVNDAYCNLVLREDIDVYADPHVYATSQRIANLGYLRADVAVTLPESLMVIERD